MYVHALVHSYTLQTYRSNAVNYGEALNGWNPLFNGFLDLGNEVHAALSDLSGSQGAVCCLPYASCLQCLVFWGFEFDTVHVHLAPLRERVGTPDF